MRRLALLLLFGSAVAAPPKVGPVPEAVRKRLRLDAFYQKHLDAGGLPVVASDKVSDRALLAAAELLDIMLNTRPDVRKAIIKAKVRFAVMAPDEMTTDIPEHRTLTPKPYWDKRARGLGATPSRPACSCGAENLLGLKGDRYRGESILIHEFSHTFHQMGLNKVDNKFEKKLKKLYADAMKAKRWEKTYAATNFIEYWAEGVQSYFDANLEAIPTNGIHNHVNTREELAQYDPGLYALIKKTFRNADWRWKDPAKR
ncbi:MAG: hypothetical protein OER88_00890 [Planctomycetota bacterium]|nr:hypothetical protein [Planctomycetota bacterium]